MQAGLTNEFEKRQKLMIEEWIRNGDWGGLCQWLNGFEYSIHNLDDDDDNNTVANSNNININSNDYLFITDESEHISTMIKSNDLYRVRILIIEQKFRPCFIFSFSSRSIFLVSCFLFLVSYLVFFICVVSFV